MSVHGQCGLFGATLPVMSCVRLSLAVVAIGSFTGPLAVVVTTGRAGAELRGPLEMRVAAAFERIAAMDPAQHAWLALDHDRVARTAQRLDADAGPPGLVEGMLIAVKDNLDTADLVTTAGSDRLRVRLPQTDATAVERVRSAGGLILGKTNLDTFARGVHTVSEVGGATANAWDSRRGPGGSSGGSAVAVATGAADAALGSDTCGSLRYPAVYNGVFGLRPTPGLVSRVGLVPLAPTQDVVGPLARNVADVAALLDVIASVDPGDPLTATAPRPETPYRRTIDGPTARIGVVRSMGVFASDRTGRTVLDVLRLSGADLVPVMLPTLPDANVIEDEYPAAKAMFLAGPLSDGRPTWLIGPLPTRDRAGYARRLANHHSAQRLLVELLDGRSLDAIVYPTTPYPPARRGMAQPSANCGLAATSGLPALAMPHGLGADGVPTVGVDLLGRPFAEARLLQIAHRYELAAGLTFPMDAIPQWRAGR